MTTIVLRNVALWPRYSDHDTTTVTIRDRRIAAIGDEPVGQDATPSDALVLDMRGQLLLPSFSDTHTHLDSSRMGLPFRPHSSDGTLPGLIRNDLDNWPTAGDTVHARASYTLDQMIAKGTTHIRTHAQIDPVTGMRRLNGINAAIADHEGRAHVEIVAFPQLGLVGKPEMPSLMEDAIARGVGLIGGIDPSFADGNSPAHLDMVFDLAERHQLPIDIHLHERGTLGAYDMRAICARTKAAGMQGKVTISHAFALASQATDAELHGLIDALADAQVSVVTVAPMHSVLPLDKLLAAGVHVGLGEDGMRDFWSPFGNADMLERTYLLAFTNLMKEDARIEAAVDVATNGGRRIMGACTDDDYAAHGLAVGCPAHLVVVPGDTVTAAVMDRAPRSLVIYDGRVVAANDEYAALCDVPEPIPAPNPQPDPHVDDDAPGTCSCSQN